MVIDLRRLRDDPDALRASQRARGDDPALVDAALAADEQRRAALGEFEALRAEQKTLGRSVAKATGDERDALLARARALAEAVKDAERRASEAEAALGTVAGGLSNLIDPDAPVGSEADFVGARHCRDAARLRG